METYFTYKGFGIRYYEIGGTAEVEEHGFPIKTFRGKGSIKGEDMVKEYIDAMTA